MAASVILYTPGSGGKAHGESVAIASNTGDFPYVLEAEPQRASYTIATTATSTATALSHLVQVMAGSSLRVYVRRIEIYQTVAATTAALMEVAVIRLTTAGTGGTTQALSALDPAAAAAGATSMTLPTVKGTEAANAMWFGACYLMQTIGASAQLAEPIMAIDFDHQRSGALIIAAGTANGICVRNTAAHAGASVRVNVILSEMNF